MNRIQLDMKRLFGFRIVADELARQQGPLQPGAKVGQKEGDKAPPAPQMLGSKIGDKVGVKVGDKTA